MQSQVGALTKLKNTDTTILLYKRNITLTNKFCSMKLCEIAAKQSSPLKPHSGKYRWYYYSYRRYYVDKQVLFNEIM